MSLALSTADRHASVISLMVMAEDWAGLARYWLALSHPPALQAAVQTLHDKGEREGGPWRELAVGLGGFAKAPNHRTLPVANEVKPLCTDAEWATLDMLGNYSFMLFTEAAMSAPPEMRPAMLELGVVTSLRNADVAASIGDLAAAAACGTQLAVGLMNQGRARESFDAASRTKEIYERLCEENREVFLRLLARSLLNLAKVQHFLGHTQEAMFSAQRAVRYARESTRTASDESTYDLALAWNNLAFMWGVLGRPATAECCIQQTIRLERKTLERHPRNMPVNLVRALGQLAQFQLRLRQLDDAKRAASEAIELVRPFRPGLDELFASVAKTLSEVCEQRGEWVEAEMWCDHVIEVRRQYPGSLGDLGDGHLNRADILSRQHRFTDAHTAIVEALKIYRQASETGPRPRNYLLALATQRRAITEQMAGDFLAALKSFTEAIELQRTIPTPVPGHTANLAVMLSNRAQTRREFSEYETALTDTKEALRIFAGLPTAIRAEFQGSEISALANLGTLHADVSNYHAAREAFALAVQQHLAITGLPPRVVYPDRARFLSNLAEAERRLGNLEAAGQNLHESIRLYRELSERHDAPDWVGLANTLTNLGNVQRDQGLPTEAADSYDQALQIHQRLSQEAPDFHRGAIARLNGNLGALWMAQRYREKALVHLEAARRLYREAGKQDPDLLLANRLSALRSLAILHSQTGSPTDPSPAFAANDVLREAWQVAETYRGHFIEPEERKRIQLDSRHIFELLVINNVCLAGSTPEVWPLQEAFEAGEAARARQLADLLTEQEKAPANTPPELVVEFQKARRRFRGVNLKLARSKQANESEVTQELTARRDAGRSKYEATIRLIRQRHDPHFDPDAQATRTTFLEIAALLPSDTATAFIQFTLLPNVGVALVLLNDGIKSVLLPDLTEAQLKSLANAWRDFSPRITGSADEWRRWETELPKLLESLARMVVWPLLTMLSERRIRRIVFCPHRELHLFPFQSCPLPDGRPLADLNDGCEVVITPSFALLKRAASSGWSAGRKLLLVENPTNDLHFAAVEGAALRRHYAPDVTSIADAEVSKQAVLRLAPACEVFHYAGHACFDSERPLHAHLRLGNTEAEWLTLAEVFASLNLRQCNLAVLSGCESAVTMPHATDDKVSLTTGFLHAGARCVLASLWPVDDLATALLMDRFHRNLQKGATPSAALSEAQMWLRVEISQGNHLIAAVEQMISLIDTDKAATENFRSKHFLARCRQRAKELASANPDRPPFTSPAHWAAFVAIGLSFVKPEFSGTGERAVRANRNPQETS